MRSALCAMAGATIWAIYMSELQTSLPETLASPDSRATFTRRAPAALQTCLVVSTSAQRAQLWVRAAHEERWATIVCTTADDAMRQSVRQRVELALIDLQSAPRAQEKTLRTLVEQLASRGGPLLAVCGRPDDITGEVWSRQLGVWMYLPGVDSQSDISLLCGEARNVLQKLEHHAAQSAG
ncbi:MAG TPA: hypothetical protein VGK58_03605 [Lacipirellulaceae bacterium]